MLPVIICRHGRAILALLAALPVALCGCCDAGPGSVDPTDAPAGSFVDVAAGGGHVCGLLSDGSVACEGEDVPPSPDGPLVSLATSSDRTCGIDGAGDVRCAGPTGETNWSGPFVEVAVAGPQMCAIRADGAVGCVQAAIGYAFSDDDGPWTGLVGAITDGAATFCAIGADGLVTCDPPLAISGLPADAIALRDGPAFRGDACVLDHGKGCGREDVSAVAISADGPVGIDADGRWVGARVDGEEATFPGDYAGVVATGALACGWRDGRRARLRRVRAGDLLLVAAEASQPRGVARLLRDLTRVQVIEGAYGRVGKWGSRADPSSDATGVTTTSGDR